jgi:hypothetical protein
VFRQAPSQPLDGATGYFTGPALFPLYPNVLLVCQWGRSASNILARLEITEAPSAVVVSRSAFTMRAPSVVSRVLRMSSTSRRTSEGDGLADTDENVVNMENREYFHSYRLTGNIDLSSPS